MKAAPISVYPPQYRLNAFDALIATMPTISTISGAQISKVSAVGIFSGATTANKVIGATIA